VYSMGTGRGNSREGGGGRGRTRTRPRPPPASARSPAPRPPRAATRWAGDTCTPASGPTEGGTRRVQLVREERRDASSQYGREGGGAPASGPLQTPTGCLTGTRTPSRLAAASALRTNRRAPRAAVSLLPRPARTSRGSRAEWLSGGAQGPGKSIRRRCCCAAPPSASSLCPNISRWSCRAARAAQRRVRVRVLLQARRNRPWPGGSRVRNGSRQ